MYAKEHTTQDFKVYNPLVSWALTQLRRFAARARAAGWHPRLALAVDRLEDLSLAECGKTRGQWERGPKSPGRARQ